MGTQTICAAIATLCATARRDRFAQACVSRPCWAVAPLRRRARLHTSFSYLLDHTREPLGMHPPLQPPQWPTEASRPGYVADPAVFAAFFVEDVFLAITMVCAGSHLDSALLLTAIWPRQRVAARHREIVPTCRSSHRAIQPLIDLAIARYIDPSIDLLLSRRAIALRKQKQHMRRVLLQASSFAVNPAPDPTVELFTLMRTRIGLHPLRHGSRLASGRGARIDVLVLGIDVGHGALQAHVDRRGSRGEKCLPAYRARLVGNSCRVWQRVLRARRDRSRHRFVVERIPHISRRKRGTAAGSIGIDRACR